ncbi:MAG: Fic family protein [Planctomycetes bacterium]|nr:Fic family protein [Planctomycetota bacterium]
MNEADFRKPATPGRLEPTVFRERIPGAPGGRQEVRGLGYVPHPLPAGLTAKEILPAIHKNLLDAVHDLAVLEGSAQRVQNPALLIGPFARKEATHSSAIENTFASQEQLVLFDVDESLIESGQRQDVQEVSNYLAALRHGWKDSRPICLNLIKEMHAILLRGSARVEGRPGEFRTTQNAIGRPAAVFKDARFVPPPPRFVAECLDSLEKYIHAESDLPMLVRVAIVHYQLECIHPFDDGNGRVGRLLVALQLSRQCGLHMPLVYMSAFFDRHRSPYYDLLYSVSSDGGWVDWINFFLAGVSVQALDAHLRTQRLYTLHSKYNELVRTKRASAILPKLIDTLFETPAITVQSVQRIGRISQPAAGKLVKKLEELGILHEHTGRRRNRVFVAREIFDIMKLDQIQSNQPPTAGGSPV